MPETNIPAGIVPQKDGSYMISFETPDGATLSPDLLETLARISRRTGCIVHLTTAQKVMLLGLDLEAAEAALSELEAGGAPVRKARDLSQPRVCVGKPYCKLALQETFSFSKAIYDRLARTPIPPKMKVAVAGCPACCSWANCLDVGFVGVRSGWKVFVGGHGGARPRPGIEMGKVADAEEAARLLGRIAEFFASEVKKKARLARMIDKVGEEEFRKRVGLSPS